MDEAFRHFTWNTGIQYSEDNTRLILIPGENVVSLQRGTQFVFVFEGFAQVSGRFGTVMLQSGMYGCFYEGVMRTYRGSMVWIVRQDGYAGMFGIGGPIEPVGRLKYIDGCTDSILIPPVKKGDPCLNHLHFPVGISQTMHTHPDIRLGVVAKGYGKCVTERREYDLVPGLVFAILPDGKHCFKTGKHTMDIIAFHPTTDVGPTDEAHPMIRRTIVDGVSAADIPEIQTA